MIEIRKKVDYKNIKKLEMLKSKMAKQILILLKDNSIYEVANYLRIEPDDLIEALNNVNANYSLYDETLSYLINKQKKFSHN